MRPGRREEVLAEMKRGSGTHSTPEIVSALLRLVPELDEELAASLKRDKWSLMLRPATV
jgi:HD-GYP domain-containing protein (c-di-GMP phosphodiesterase class II)